MYNILIVDDEKIERNGIVFLMKRMGITLEISEAANGLAALDILKKQKIDILLTDVKMPFMDGIELIRNAVTLTQNMKIIIFSGYNEFEYAKLAVKLGVSDYILKPVDPQEFDHTMKSVIKELDSMRIADEKKNESSEYMTEYLLYSLISGTDPKHVHVQCERLLDEQKVWNRYKKMLLLEFDRDVYGKIITDFCGEVMTQFSFPFQYLNLNQQQSVLLFDEDRTMDAAQTARQLADAIERFYHVKCYIAIADEIEDYEQMPKYMEKLEELMENRFYQTDTYIYSSDMEDASPVNVKIDDDTLMKQMQQDIRMKDIASLRQHFERLCSKYRAKSYFSHIYIKFIFSNLLKNFYEKAPDLTEEELNQEIEKLYQAVDFKCITEIIQKNIDRLEKVFAEHPQTTHKEIEVVKKYIYEHFDEEIGVDQLARIVYLTPSYLSSIFKKETGQNLSKFIKQFRMERAKDMLENTTKKIVSISNEVGYPNVSYFCQSFRECFGVSPQKYRSNGG